VAEAMPDMEKDKKRMRAEAAIIKDARAKKQEMAAKQHAAYMAAAAAALKREYRLLEPLKAGRKSRRRGTRKGRRRKTKKDLRRRRH